MTGLLTIGWTRAQAKPQTARLPEALAALAAAAMLIASTAAGVMEQSALQSQSEQHRARRPALLHVAGTRDRGRRLHRERPTRTRAWSPSAKQGGDSLTIDPVHWYTDPFKSPIYYGARVARWFTGGRTGVMVDFIHSKAIARLDREADFSGSVNGAPVQPRARLDEVAKKLEFSHGHNMLLFNGLVRLPSIGARLSPYAGLGAGVLLPHTEVQLAEQGATRTYDYNYAGPAAQALFGIEVRLSAAVVLRGVQVHVRRLRVAAVADERHLAFRGSVAAVAALVPRRGAGGRPHHDEDREPSGGGRLRGAHRLPRALILAASPPEGLLSRTGARTPKRCA